MKKEIKTSKGIELRECNEEFLNEYRGLVYKTVSEHRKGYSEIHEDEKQELDLVIFKAFLKYDLEKGTVFSTYLVWQVRSYLGGQETSKGYQKNDDSEYTFINLDYDINNSGDGEKSFHETLADEKANFEADFEDEDMIKFIATRCNDLEKELLLVNLKIKTLTEVSKELGKSKSNLSNHNKRFKLKLIDLINEYKNEDLLFNTNNEDKVEKIVETKKPVVEVKEEVVVVVEPEVEEKEIVFDTQISFDDLFSGALEQQPDVKAEFEKNCKEECDEVVEYITSETVLINTFDGADLTINIKEYEAFIEQRRMFYDLIDNNDIEALTPYLGEDVDIEVEKCGVMANIKPAQLKERFKILCAESELLA